MLKFIRPVIALACTLEVCPAVAIDYSIPFDMAAVRVFNPTSPEQIGGGAHAFGPASSSYIQPALLNNFAVVTGDSRNANAGGVSYAGNLTVTSSLQIPGGYPYYIYEQSNWAFIPEFGYNYGIGGTTSASLAARASLVSSHCEDTGSIGSACYTSPHATLSASLIVSASPQTASFNAAAFSGTVNAAETYTVMVANVIQTNCQISGSAINAIASGSATIPGGCVNAAGGANTPIEFVPSVLTPYVLNYWSLLTASGVVADAGSNFGPWGASPDIDQNKNGGGMNYGGSYSLVTDPAVPVFTLVSTNDGSLGTAQSAYDLTSYFNQLSNKILIVNDEFSRGAATGWNVGQAAQFGSPELKTIPATTGTCGAYTTAYCITVANASTFISEVAESLAPLPVYYAPAGTTATGPFVASTTPVDGQALTYCSTCTVANVPQGSYILDGLGHYAFNSADQGRQLAIWYRYASGGSSISLQNHQWMRDSTHCATTYSSTNKWTDPVGGGSYSVPGGSCPGLFNWVHYAGSWAVSNDTASGSLNYTKPFFSHDGIHFEPYGGEMVGRADIAEATALNIVPATIPFHIPTTNNPPLGGVTSTATTAVTLGSYYGTCASTQQKYFLTAATLGTQTIAAAYAQTGGPALLSSLVGATIRVPGTAIPVGTKISCVDYVNNLIGLNAAAVTNAITYPLTGEYVAAQLDTNSVITDGVFSYAYGGYIGSMAIGGTTVEGCGGAGNPYCPAPVIPGWTISHTIPVNWVMWLDSISSGASNDCTVSGGTPTLTRLQTCTGKLGLSYGIAKNPADGYDALVVQLQGMSAPTTGVGSVNFAVPLNTQEKALLTSGTQQRAMCRVIIGPGPNGHLNGVIGAQVKFIATQTTTFTPPGMSGFTGQTTYTGSAVDAGAQNGSAASPEMSDIYAANGSPNVIAVTGAPTGYMRKGDILTPPNTIAGTAPNANGVQFNMLSVSVQFNNYTAVSGTILIEGCAVIPATQ